MATKPQLEATTTAIRGDIEQVHLRLNTMEHSVSSRFEQVETELSRLRGAVYLLGKDRPDILRLLGPERFLISITILFRFADRPSRLC